VLIDSDPDHAWLAPLFSSEKPGEDAESAQAEESPAAEARKHSDPKVPGS
jgi:hypothetical protein